MDACTEGRWKGRDEGNAVFASLPFTCITQAVQYIEITLPIFIHLIPYLFNPLCLILPMAGIEQWFTISKWAILSSCHYTERNYIKHLIPSACVLCHHPPFFFHSLFFAQYSNTICLLLCTSCCIDWLTPNSHSYLQMMNYKRLPI